jgi:hypothetical protein
MALAVIAASLGNEMRAQAPTGPANDAAEIEALLASLPMT